MTLAISRVIPVLLIEGEDLVKTIGFKERIYVGDPINAVRIFNEKEVDELAIIDIRASSRKAKPNFSLIEDLASEAFMPLTVGGGIKDIADAEQLFRLGVEKILIDSLVYENPDMVMAIISKYGAQAVSVVMTTQSALGGTKVLSPTGRIPLKRALEIIGQINPGEVVVYSSDRDGKRSGYDTATLSTVAERLNCPVVALGGASSPKDFVSAISAGADAVAAGALFCLQGKFNSPLISYPNREEIDSSFSPQQSNL